MAHTAKILLLGSGELGREFTISAKRLGELLGRPVELASDTGGPDSQAKAKAHSQGLSHLVSKCGTPAPPRRGCARCRQSSKRDKQPCVCASEGQLAKSNLALPPSPWHAAGRPQTTARCSRMHTTARACTATRTHAHTHTYTRRARVHAGDVFGSDERAFWW